MSFGQDVFQFLSILVTWFSCESLFLAWGSFYLLCRFLCMRYLGILLHMNFSFLRWS